MSSRKKKPEKLTIEAFIEGGQWRARGMHVEPATTLQALRMRLRAEAKKQYGPDVDLALSIRVPASIRSEVEQNKEWRLKARQERTELRQNTAEIVHRLRRDLGMSYDDAAVLLGVDASVLMRIVHSTTTLIKTDDDDSDV